MTGELALLGLEPSHGSLALFRRIDRWLVLTAHYLCLVHMRPSVSYASFALVFGVLFFPVVLATPELGGGFLQGLLTHYVSGVAGLQAYLSSPAVAAISLTFAVLLIVAINRAWALNEQGRDRLAQNLVAGDDVGADRLPDLRDEAVVAGLLLLVLIPFWLMSLNQVACDLWGVSACLYDVQPGSPSGSSIAPWFVFTGEAFFRALVFFDFPEVYDWQSLGAVTVANDAGYHLVMVVRVLIDVLIITSILQVVRINRSIGDAIATLDREADRAVRTGKRIVNPLIAELRRASEEDPQKAKAKHANAAQALQRIEDPRAIHGLMALLTHHYARVRELAAQAIGVLAVVPATSETRRTNALQKLKVHREQEDKVTVQQALDAAIGAIEAV